MDIRWLFCVIQSVIPNHWASTVLPRLATSLEFFCDPSRRRRALCNNAHIPISEWQFKDDSTSIYWRRIQALPARRMKFGALSTGEGSSKASPTGEGGRRSRAPPAGEGLEPCLPGMSPTELCGWHARCVCGSDWVEHEIKGWKLKSSSCSRRLPRLLLQPYTCLQ